MSDRICLGMELLEVRSVIGHQINNPIHPGEFLS